MRILPISSTSPPQGWPRSKHTYRGFSFAELAPEGDLTLGALAILFVKDGAHIERGAVQVQRDGHIGVARIFDPVKPERIVNVAHAIRFQRAARKLLQLVPIVFHLFASRLTATNVRLAVLRDRRILRPGIARLHQLALEHLHEAMRIGMIVDGRCVPFVPAENHQVVLAITGIYQISGVAVCRQNSEERMK